MAAASVRHPGRAFDEVADEYERRRPTYPDELTAVLGTLSFDRRITPNQREALQAENDAIYERLGRPIRSSTAAVLVTARLRGDV